MSDEDKIMTGCRALVESGDYQDLIDASMFAIGWMMGKHGINDAPPIHWLAKSLRSVGVKSGYLEAIVTLNREVR